MKQLLMTTAMMVGLAGFAGAEDRPITYVPEGGYAATVETTYVAPSATESLTPGNKIADLTALNYAGETILQRLNDRSYWVQKRFYNTVFYVGDDSVLLLDPLGMGSGQAVLEAIRSVTDKPIDTIILSHHHPDHIGDLTIFAEAAKEAGYDLRVIASAETAEDVDGVTEVLTADQNTTTFEDQTIELIRFDTPAHTHDSAAWLLKEQGILHAPDMLNPDQMPYRGFGGSETFVGYSDNIDTLAAQDFAYFSGGHGNIGSPEDVAFMQEYLVDLQKAVDESYATANFGDYMVPEYGNHQASATAWIEALDANALEALRPKYGDFYGFDASVPVQIYMVRESLR